MLSGRRVVVDALRRWVGAGQPAVLATVVTSSGSAPRGLGAQLAVTRGDLWAGGLSGGCAEVAVLTAAAELLDGDDTAGATWLELVRDELGSVGPVCGATLGVVVERVDAELLGALEHLLHDASSGAGAGWRREYSGEGGGRLARRSVARTPAGAAGIHVEGSPSGSLAIVEALAAPPRAIVAGAGDIAAELLTILRGQGWRTALLDPRGAFVAHTLSVVTPGEVIRAWPDRDVFAGLDVDSSTACIAAAHEERLDQPFLEAALRSPAFYVGAVGSRLVQHQRRAALAAEGLDEAALERLHGPAGLDLGGGGAAQIALAIAAEVTAAWNGRKGGALVHSRGPIRA